MSEAHAVPTRNIAQYLQPRSKARTDGATRPRDMRDLALWLCFWVWLFVWCVVLLSSPARPSQRAANLT